MKLSLKLLVVSVVLVGVVGCGGMEPCQGQACQGVEEVGEVQQVQDFACPVNDPTCNPPGEEDDAPPPYSIGLTITNQTARNSVWVFYSIVVKTRAGQVRSDMSRWGSIKVDAYGTGYLNTPATAYWGDNVTVNTNHESLSTTQTFSVTKSMHCNGVITMFDGVPVPSTSCQ